MSASDQQVKRLQDFVCDPELSHEEAAKLVIWGNGSFEMSLNYYYNSRQPKETKPQVPKGTGTAWEKLKHGARKEKETSQHIQKLKQEYKLPVTSKHNSKQYFEKKSQFFTDVDYLPNIMNTHINSEATIGANQAQSEEDSEEDQKTEDRVERPIQLEENQTKTTYQPVAHRKSTPQLPRKSLSELFSKKPQSTKIESIPVRQTRPPRPNSLGSLYLGQCFIDCFTMFKIDLSRYNNQEIELKYYANKKPQKVRKGAKAKTYQEKVVIRLNWDGQEIGRFQDNESRVFCHLLDKGYISIKGWLYQYPQFLIQGGRYRLKAQVNLQQKAITIPVVDTFQDENKENPILIEFKNVKEQLNSLLQKMKLEILTPPLILMKPKYQTSNRAIIHSNYELDDKASRQLVEKMTNPFYKERQSKLTTITKSPEQRKKPLELAMNQQSNNIEIVEDQCQQLINLNDQKLQPTYPPRNTFISQLHEYQALALTWTLRRQEQQKEESKEQLHPMWMEYQMIDKESLFFNQFTGQVSMEPPIHKDRCRGGILADEMGLGKTVMMIALFTANKETECKYKTLVVLPLTLLDQWESQINTHTNYGSLKVHKYYEHKSRSQSLDKFDVVLTTYGVISHEFAQGMHISNKGLYKHQWFRVVLDQAHYIKGRVIQTSRAVFQLRSQIRWCLTGTPIQNRLDDIYSLVHFIKYTPWSNYRWWNSYINKPHNEGDPAVFPVLRAILKTVLLRRTKQSKLENGQFIISLPPKVSRIKFLKFSNKERDFYDAVYEVSKKEFDQLDRQGVVEAKYMRIFQILIRLRQICCHPVLFKSVSKLSNVEEFEAKLKKFVEKKTAQRRIVQDNPSHFQVLMQGNQESLVSSAKLLVNQSHLNKVMTNIRNNALDNCLVCLSQLQNPVITACLHIFCRLCFIQTINNVRGFCPMCRTILSKDDFMHLPMDSRLKMDFKSNFERSTKMQALYDLISGMEEDDKTVVFSQFLGMLDLIEEDFKRSKVNYVRMDGSLSQKERGVVIQKFKLDKKCKVFLISLKTGGVGLNLVAANKVILVDPWWNPAVEQQAIERVHRIGQERSVQVWRLIIQNSIQSRMMELHESKRNVSNMAISERDNRQNHAQKFKYLMSRY